MTDGSTRVVLAALAGNLAIAATKFSAFAFTGSSAMLTEAIHSVVDTGDQLLLLVGQHRAAAPADQTHPFGYGMELYFWSFIVALMVFVAGGMAAIWQGWLRIVHPDPIARPWINFLVLAVSALFEAGSFAAAYREYRRIVRGRNVNLLQFLKLSKDPGVFGVLLEDGAAMIGLVIAALGIAGTAILDLPWADGLASVLIGVLLVGVALFLANETRSLIAGEAAAPPIVDAVRAVLSGDRRVARIADLRSLHLGPRTILVAATLEFRPSLSADETNRAANELIQSVKAADQRIGPVFVRPSSP